MNYLRGAVNAISAPYQYYKELAPLNPSTLTGAIDVIVVRVSDGNGTVELVCSPFHVRFGKWQVLRPGDKKVNVSVNGNPIPFNMKIGEAGEAFFVFETDAEVPEDLITSPILDAVRPGEASKAAVKAGKFGSKEDSDGDAPEDAAAQEPEYFDLNATAPPSAEHNQDQRKTPTEAHPSEPVPSVLSSAPSLGQVVQAVRPGTFLNATASLGKAVAHAVAETTKEKEEKLRDEIDAAHNMAKHLRDGQQNPKNTSTGIHEGQGDEALPEMDSEDSQPNKVMYTGDVVIDLAGYHGRDASDRTITADSEDPGTPRTESTPEAPSSPEDESYIPFPGAAKDYAATSNGHGSPLKPSPFPMRATSEPPPDIELDNFDLTLPSPTEAHTHSPRRPKHRPQPSDAPQASGSGGGTGKPGLGLGLGLAPPQEEYMWEWGAFPQRSPVVETFEPRGLRAAKPRWKGKGREAFDARELSRAQSEPPELDEGERTVRPAPASVGGDAGDDVLGAGGRLIRDRADPTRMGVWLDGRTVWFELSVVEPDLLKKENGRKGALGGLEEMDAAEAFDKDKVTLERFLDDETILEEPGLVLRWADDRYITRADGSPLLDVLPWWRTTTLDARAAGAPSRPLSPLPEERSLDDPLSSGDEGERSRTVSESGTPIIPAPPRPPRKTSSWVRWWGRSTRTDADLEAGHGHGINGKPDMRSNVSTPGQELRNPLLAPGTPTGPRPSSAASAPPALPPVAPDTPSDQDEQNEKKYVKTLRLTSDQLKALDLKVGSNSITFSLSASGAAACTARIFVWDSTDSIVISDIDGTITKSDALGHVFTMIGRDWTHLGVAKLYTDICKNGYKIMYLTSRAIGQADSTRDYLKGIKQNNYQLPEGPVIMSPDRLMASLHREVIMRKPEVFKMACLRDIRRLFGNAGNPFYAGFGNRITDALSYRSVDVPSSRIFTIDSTGDVKMELLELAGYKSSYIHMTDLVDQMFPPIHRRWAAEYTDSNFWKPPIGEFDLPDLTPPSPALSARSDMSNQSTLARLRNFSLTTRARSPPRSRLHDDALGEDVDEHGDAALAATGASRGKNAHLRQMSSFERFSQTLGLGSASEEEKGSGESPLSSATAIGSGDEEDEVDVDWQGKRRARARGQSVSSMPGSLPGSDEDIQFGVDDDDAEEGEEGYGYEDDGEGLDPDETFDEDLLAAGEMAQVPFL